MSLSQYRQGIRSLPRAELRVLAESRPDTDGVLFQHGLLWLLANQVDQLLDFDKRSPIPARAGGFQGIVGNGVSRGLLLPARLAVQGDWMLIGNSASVAKQGRDRSCRDALNHL